MSITGLKKHLSTQIEGYSKTFLKGSKNERLFKQWLQDVERLELELEAAKEVDMTTAELKKIEGLAGRATPGPYEYDSCGDVWTTNTEVAKDRIAGMTVFHTFATAPTAPDNPDAAYFAALSPEVVTAMTAEIRSLGARCRRLQEVLAYVQLKAPGYDWNRDPLSLTLRIGEVMAPLGAGSKP